MNTNNLDHLSPVWTHLTHIQPERAEGIYLFDAVGNRYTDFTCGIGVTNTGHCHPRVVQAIQEQTEKLIFGQMNIVIPPVSVALTEALNEITPPTIDTFFLSNSGAEAVEASVKLARHATGKRNIIVFQGSFHGRTAQTMAMTTSKYIYRHDYQPLPSGIFVAPYPYSYFYSWDEEKTTEFCMRQLDLLLHGQTTSEDTAAIIIEPLLGEGGYVPAPLGFLQKLRELCIGNDILFIADEVQSGFGRTGRWFAHEHFDVEPDIMVMAKAIASGFPLSGIAARSELMAKWIPGSHGGTYGGNAIACAAAVATIRTIREEGLLENARQSGAWLMEQLRALQAEFSIIGDVRGLGLMIGVEFTAPDGSPATDLAKALGKGCLKRHLLLLTCGPWSNTVRWIPPLTVTREQMEEALTTFKDALAEAVA